MERPSVPPQDCCLLLQDHEQQLSADLISVISNFFHHRANKSLHVLYPDKTHLFTFGSSRTHADKYLGEDLNQAVSMNLQDQLSYINRV